MQTKSRFDPPRNRSFYPYEIDNRKLETLRTFEQPIERNGHLVGLIRNAPRRQRWAYLNRAEFETWSVRRSRSRIEREENLAAARLCVRIAREMRESERRANLPE